MNKFFVVLMLCSFTVLAAPVNINSADAETISKALKGVGPKKAEEIVQYRKAKGDFKTLKDLENVKGIGAKTVKANEKDILFSDSAVPASSNAPAPAPVEAKPDAAKKPD